MKNLKLSINIESENFKIYKTLLGSFSPTNWTIKIAGKKPKQLSQMSQSQRITLSHEFGHFLHYFTTYLGLTHLTYWLMELSVLHEDQDQKSDEEYITYQSERILEITRNKQILCIDDEYYYEKGTNLLLRAEARRRSEAWLWAETTGALFRTDGKISDRRFWGIRFYLGHRHPSRSFCRIPIGMRTILEHMAVAIDLVAEFASIRNPGQMIKALRNTIDASYQPDLLHYYALAQYMSSRFTNGTLESALPVYIVTAHLVMLAANVPFDDRDIWKALQRAAASVHKDIAEHMQHPHPSFVFPLLASALIELNPSQADVLDPRKFSAIGDAVLGRLGLPTMENLKTYRERRLNDVLHIQTQCDPTGTKQRLMKWIVDYDRRLTRSEKLINPTKNLENDCPIPIVFEDGFFEGSIISVNDTALLSMLERRVNEMLRYPVFRNIIKSTD